MKVPPMPDRSVNFLRRVPCVRAFSLVELLTVIAIISVLAAAAVPSLQGRLDGISITGGANITETELSLARQTAMSRNLPVEVRIYKQNDGGGDYWRAIALVIPASVSGQAKDEWITGGKVLPGNVILDDAESLSTVLSEATSGGTIAPWSGVETSSAPPMLRNKPYVGFYFKPNGSVELPPDQPWCLTVTSPNKAKSSTGRPANFVSLVIDSATGRTLAFQP